MDIDELVKRLEAAEARIAVLEGRRAQSACDGFKLCYVAYNEAWFTTQELDKQWGDDWNDAPYEHNAGDPYEWRQYMKDSHGTEPYELMTIHYRGLSTPADRAYGGNSSYSVDIINTGAIPWLSSDDEKVHIFAGVSPEEFKQLVRAGGGTVYITDDGSRP